MEGQQPRAVRMLPLTLGSGHHQMAVVTIRTAIARSSCGDVRISSATIRFFVCLSTSQALSLDHTSYSAFAFPSVTLSYGRSPPRQDLYRVSQVSREGPARNMVAGTKEPQIRKPIRSQRAKFEDIAKIGCRSFDYVMKMLAPASCAA